MEFKDMFVMFLIVGLFIFGIITFSIMMSSENDAPVSLNQNPAINKMFGNVSRQLNESQVTSEEAREGLEAEESNPVFTTLGFVFKSILTATRTFMSMGVNMFIYIFTFAQESLGISPIVTGTLMAILIGVLVLGIWSLVRAGR